MVGKVGVGREDLSGRRFGRLLCVESESRIMSSKRRQVYWKCQCDCGNVAFVRPQQLKEGITVSCGCYNKERVSEPRKHGMSNSPEYKIFKDIKRRCEEPNRKSYKNYGGRGIKCLWESFEQFYEEMGTRPSNKHTIERKNVDGDYCKENCIWTDDLSLQAYNRRPKSNSKTNIPGVTEDTAGYGYLARISVNYKRIYLGFFKSLYDAAKARKEAELQYYGFNLKWEMPNENE